MQQVKNENASLKASNDNHIYINEKLNKALQKTLAAKQKERVKKEKKLQQESDIPKQANSPRQHNNIGSKEQLSSAYQGMPSMSNMISASQVINADTADCTLPSKKLKKRNQNTETIVEKMEEDDPATQTNNALKQKKRKSVKNM